MDIKQEGGKINKLGKQSRINISSHRQAHPRLPIAWWLPKLGGEDAPNGPLPKAMPKSPHPFRTTILQDLFFQLGCAWWEVLLFLLFQTVLVMRGSCSVPSLVGVCHLQGKVGMGIQQVAGEGLWPPGSGSSPPPFLMAQLGRQNFL